MIYITTILYGFSLNSVLFLKKQNEPKLVAKPNTKHLTYNLLSTKRISNSIAIKKVYKELYKKLMISYNLFISNTKKKSFSIFSLFVFILQKDLMYNNAFYSLYFWSKPFNIIFRMEWTRKINIPTIWIRYVSFKRRFLIIWKWLGILVRFYKTVYLNFLSSFFSLWVHFFLTPSSENKLNTIRLRVYKIYLYKLF